MKRMEMNQTRPGSKKERQSEKKKICCFCLMHVSRVCVGVVCLFVVTSFRFGHPDMCLTTERKHVVVFVSQVVAKSLFSDQRYDAQLDTRIKLAINDENIKQFDVTFLLFFGVFSISSSSVSCLMISRCPKKKKLIVCALVILFPLFLRQKFCLIQLITLNLLLC